MNVILACAGTNIVVIGRACYYYHHYQFLAMHSVARHHAACRELCEAFLSIHTKANHPTDRRLAWHVRGSGISRWASHRIASVFVCHDRPITQLDLTCSASPGSSCLVRIPGRERHGLTMSFRIAAKTDSARDA